MGGNADLGAKSRSRKPNDYVWGYGKVATHDQGDVCTENSIRIDHVSESPNLSGDDRSVLPLAGPVCLAVQVEEPT
jgi:hypothetical protein